MYTRATYGERHPVLNMQYCVELSTMPSLFSLYRKIFFGKKPGWDQQPLASIQVSCDNIHLSIDKVIQYSQVCGFEFDGKHIPITYLHVLAFRLQAFIFIQPSITFPLLGMIHLRNQITHYRPVTVNEVCSAKCQLTSSRENSAGLEFDMVTQVYVKNELVWESVSTYLYRTEQAQRPKLRRDKSTSMIWDNPSIWQLGDELGRRYAIASGDFNLIHLHPILSKRYGFDKILAHGMWSKARCVAELSNKINNQVCTVDVSFKLPLFMPAEVTFGQMDIDNGVQFELRDKRGRRPHLTGELTYL